MAAKLKPRRIFKCCKGGFHAKGDENESKYNKIPACLKYRIDTRRYFK